MRLFMIVQEIAEVAESAGKLRKVQLLPCIYMELRQNQYFPH